MQPAGSPHSSSSAAPLARALRTLGALAPPRSTLTNLAASEGNRLDILREGAATVLAALLRSGAGGGSGGAGTGAAADRTCRYVAARALQNLAKCRHGPARRQMLVRGCAGRPAKAVHARGSEEGG
jgi:hypothetical protein